MWSREVRRIEAIEIPQEVYDDDETEVYLDPGMNVGEWVGLIVGAMVLVIIVAALFGPLNTAMANYAANETVFGPILQVIVPLVIGVGILLAFVGGFLGFRSSKKKGGLG
jgi:hypothetical protein